MILERLPEVLQLTRAEQAELCGELVELLAENGDWQKLSPEVMAELDREMEEYRRKSSSGRTWEQVQARIATGDWRQWQK